MSVSVTRSPVESTVRPKTPRTGPWLLTGDLIVIAFAVGAAQVLRFGPHGVGVSLGVVDTSYTALSMTLGVSWILALQLFRAYESWPKHLTGPRYRQPLRATFALFGALAIYSLLFQLDISRGYLAVALPVGLVGLIAVRALARRSIASAHAKGLLTRRALVVGTPASAAHLAAALEKARPPIGIEIVGAAPVDARAAETLPRTVASAGIEIVIVADAREDMDIRELLWLLEDTGAVVWLSVDVPELASPRAQFHPIAQLPVVEVEPADRSTSRLRMKRLFDIVFSTLALVFAAPVIAICAVVTLLDSRGPAFFRQQRIGRGGEPFEIVKVRTMRPDAEQELDELRHLNEGAGPLFKIRADPRVTRFGRILRATSLDELPQLWNVLKGDMSVVGPRPPLPNEVDQYDAASHRRLSVKPGLTGLWQVSGRSDLSWEQGLRLDLFYVENWTLLGDLRIILQTVGVVLRPQGAY